MSHTSDLKARGTGNGPGEASASRYFPATLLSLILTAAACHAPLPAPSPEVSTPSETTPTAHSSVQTPARSQESERELPRVRLRTTLGEILLEIEVHAAPLTAANFLAHVDEGLLEKAHFYRVVTLDNQPDNEVKIEVIQGGLGFDAASPRPPIQHETTEETGLRHLDGVISMARLEPGTATSEFFITIGDQPELDFSGARNPDGQGFAAFGRVIRGMEVVREIQRQDADGQMLIESVAVTNVRRLP